MTTAHPSIAALPATQPSTTTTVIVPANAVIFLAGRTDAKLALPGPVPAGYPICRNDNNPGPYSEAFPLQLPSPSIAIFQFSARGTVKIGQYNIFGPDGYQVDYSYLLDSSLDGISGFEGPVGALAGVFLDDQNLGDRQAPQTLEFVGNCSFHTLSTALGQVFLIGDGLTGTGIGEPQSFVGPEGATRLFLGIPDAANANGPPGGYDDNDPTTAFQVIVKRVPAMK